MTKFIELLDDNGNSNLFKVDTVARVYLGEMSGELIIQFVSGSVTPTFKTSRETMESFREKVGMV